MLFGQVEADDISTVLFEKSCKVFLGAGTSLVFHLVDDYVGLGGHRVRRLRPKERN